MLLSAQALPLLWSFLSAWSEIRLCTLSIRSIRDLCETAEHSLRRHWAQGSGFFSQLATLMVPGDDDDDVCWEDHFVSSKYRRLSV